MSSTVTSTPSAFRPAANLSSLPFELIMAILEQCDDYLALHALRRTCKTFRMYIDNNPSFDKFLFRNRPLTNPILNSVELIKIRSLARTEESTADPCLSEVSPHIKVHPILSRIGWVVRVKEGDVDVDVDVDDDDDDDFDVDDDDNDDDDEDAVKEVYIVNSGLKMKDVPHLLDECATCPPVSAVEVLVDLRHTSDYKGHYETPKPKLEPTNTSHSKPVLVRDVFNLLLSETRALYQQHCDYLTQNDYEDDDSDSADFKTTGSPSVMVWRNDLFLRFPFRLYIARHH